VCRSQRRVISPTFWLASRQRAEHRNRNIAHSVGGLSLPIDLYLALECCRSDQQTTGNCSNRVQPHQSPVLLIHCWLSLVRRALKVVRALNGEPFGGCVTASIVTARVTPCVILQISFRETDKDC